VIDVRFCRASKETAGKAPQRTEGRAVAGQYGGRICGAAPEWEPDPERRLSVVLRTLSSPHKHPWHVN